MNAHELRMLQIDVAGHLSTDGETARPSGKELLESVWSGAAGELARFACALGIDDNAADDVLQEVYVTAWRKCPSQIDNNELRRWLFRVTANCCNQVHRQRGRRRRLLDGWRRTRDSNETAPSAAELAQRREDHRVVKTALLRLRHEERVLLVLRYFQDFNATQIGQILELTPSTVRSRLHAARRKLAAELKDYGANDDE